MQDVPLRHPVQTLDGRALLISHSVLCVEAPGGHLHFQSARTGLFLSLEGPVKATPNLKDPNLKK